MTLPAFPRYWFSRLILSLEVLVLIVVVSWFEPESITAQAIDKTGDHGWSLVWGLCACCLIGISDVIVNDLMPRRFSLPTALAYRYVGYMGMALMLAMIAVLVAFVHGFTVLLLAYWLNAGLAAAVTFFDIFARYRP